MGNFPSVPQNVSRGPNLLASFWTPFSFTVIFLVARIYVRVRKWKLGLDDWSMILGWLLYLAALIVGSVIITLGGGRHLQYVPSDNLFKLLRLDYTIQPLGLLAAFFAKTSVALFLPRIMGQTSTYRKLFLYALIFVNFALTVTNIGTLYGQCDPPTALWHPELVYEGKAHCWNSDINRDVSVAQGSFSAFTDFALALLPITIVYSLQVSLAKRIGLCVLLGFGIFAGICCSIKTAIYLDPIDISDLTWSTYKLYLWSALEIPFIIIAGCIPAAKPFWDYFFYGKPITPEPSSSRFKRSYSSARSGSNKPPHGSGSGSGSGSGAHGPAVVVSPFARIMDMLVRADAPLVGRDARARARTRSRSRSHGVPSTGASGSTAVASSGGGGSKIATDDTHCCNHACPKHCAVEQAAALLRPEAVATPPPRRNSDEMV